MANDQITFRIDAGLSAFFAILFGLFIFTAYAPSPGVDAGVVNGLVAVFYFGPASVLLATAALSASKRWRSWRALHWLAVSFAVLPIVTVSIYALTGHAL